MRIPSTIKIGGLRYKITIKDKISEKNAVASCDTKTQEIELEKSAKASMEVSLIHEILHAINVSMEDLTVEFLAQAFYQIIIDNPLLFKEGGEKIHVYK